MKLFFLASIAVDNDRKKSYRLISDICRNQGCDVSDEHLFEEPAELIEQFEEELVARTRKLVSQMLQSDAVVFEGTHSTTGGGYFISQALQKNIPVLFLIQRKYTGLYIGDPNRLIKIEEYKPTREAELRKKIAKFLAFAQKKKLTKRFNLMIDESIDSYLETQSDKLQISKADLVRNFIYESMQNVQSAEEGS